MWFLWAIISFITFRFLTFSPSMPWTVSEPHSVHQYFFKYHIEWKPGVLFFPSTWIYKPLPFPLFCFWCLDWFGDSHRNPSLPPPCWHHPLSSPPCCFFPSLCLHRVLYAADAVPAHISLSQLPHMWCFPEHICCFLMLCVSLVSISSYRYSQRPEAPRRAKCYILVWLASSVKAGWQCVRVRIY